MQFESDSDSDRPPTPPEIAERATAVTLNLLPTKSRVRYEKEYELFMKWRELKKTKSFSEAVLLVYLEELSKSVKSSTLWSRYSMLRATLTVKHDVDISKYTKLIAFLKKQSVGYEAKQSKTFTKENIFQFFNTASDEEYLLIKVIAIMGLSGACRCDELRNLMVDDIEDMQSHLVVHIRKTKTGKLRTFMVVSVWNELTNDLNLVEIYRKYLSLRPASVPHRRLFLNYQKGKCTVQPVGINKFSKVPQMIAKFLKISDACLFTGHCWRRTSATLLVDGGADLLTLKRHGGWKSSAVAERYLEDSSENKMSIARKILGDHNSSNPSIISSTSSSTTCTSTVVEKLIESSGSEDSINANNCVFNFHVNK